MRASESAISRARLEKEQALARLRQLQSGQLEGRLLDRHCVNAEWASAFAALRDRALGMGDRIVARGAGRTAEALRAIVDAEVRDLLSTENSATPHGGPTRVRHLRP